MRLKKRRKSYRRIVLILLVCLGLPGCSGKPEIMTDGIFETVAENISEEMTETEKKTEIQTEPFMEPETEEMIQVFVCGAVENPGVYNLKVNARIYEAVDAAGGFTQDADRDWLNLAGPLQDGGKLRVYTLEEAEKLREQGFAEQGVSDAKAWQQGASGEDPGGWNSGTDSNASDKVNLNTATREQLMTLPGIGEAKADAVIAYREEHGSFRNIEEIKNISGIKEAVFLKIKDKIEI